MLAVICGSASDMGMTGSCGTRVTHAENMEEPSLQKLRGAAEQNFVQTVGGTVTDSNQLTAVYWSEFIGSRHIVQVSLGLVFL